MCSWQDITKLQNAATFHLHHCESYSAQPLYEYLSILCSTWQVLTYDDEGLTVKCFSGFHTSTKRVQELREHLHSSEHAFSSLLHHRIPIRGAVTSSSHWLRSEQLESCPVWLWVTTQHNTKKQCSLVSGNLSLTRNKDLLITAFLFLSL